MIETKDLNRSLLIPKWLSPRSSFVEDFLFASNSNVREIVDDVSRLRGEVDDFRSNPSTTQSADLLHASIVLGEPEIAHDLATYIVSHERGPLSFLRVAKRVLGDNQVNLPELRTRDLIAQTRAQLKEYPKDPLLWIDLARLYTIKGQLWKAKPSVQVAVSLAGSNRFVSRAAARFFVHVNEPDVSVHVLSRAYEKNPDPMILATLINCCILEEKEPVFFRRSTMARMSKDAKRDASELLATAGILEMRSGNDRLAKRYFRSGWRDPTENVIAHADWVIRHKYAGISVAETLDFNRSSEANTWRRFYGRDLVRAVEMATKWSLEEPYSTHPFSCGSSIACDAGMYKEAVNFARTGRVANPDDLVLRNNLAYALLKAGSLEEADQELSMLPSCVADNPTALIAATRGYSCFKHGRIEEGRRLYCLAIDYLKSIQDLRLVAKAMLCHAFAECEADSDEALESASLALAASRGFDDPSIEVLRESVERK